ncbi:response regulator [Novosphingobium aerophilum]|uniref:response regulator n=1 Tax=Novosphingobium TaxID=165696 RepID=UPI0006C8B3E5|nr:MULTISPECIES: response regulator [unclassified Novosphingobium]KPH62847.1 chemotaxis protein CheY [Novosphingobium sp. ST904]TCM39199.1 two-component system chemotaxis response regulator CheY [Novosphingobium sp. ST904]WRT92758.1 response regulator [Novosphingobium sp. RL4]
MPAASAIKVMVVDDQTSMRAMIRRTLQDLGFKDIRDKAGPAEALAAIKSDRVHLIISDYNMPDMDGLEFLEAVRQDPVIGKTVFIMLTGSADKEVVQKAAALGVNNYVVKPFAPAALKEKIERVFGELV